MRNFVVTLRNGLRVTVRADRVARPDGQYLALVLAGSPSIADPNPDGDPVALFDNREVVSVVARENLVSEEKGEPVEGPLVVRHDDSDIPF